MVTPVALLRTLSLVFYAKQLTHITPYSHPVLFSMSWMEWGQDNSIVPFRAKAHCLSSLLRTNSDSALHQSTMTPTQPEPFTGGSQDTHQKRGIGRAHGHVSSVQASPMGGPCAPRGHKLISGQICKGRVSGCYCGTRGVA